MAVALPDHNKQPYGKEVDDEEGEDKRENLAASKGVKRKKKEFHCGIRRWIV